MREFPYQVAVLLVDIHIPEAQSLKDKRMVVRQIKDKVRAQFNVSISELDGHDKWQACSLGFAMVGQDGRYMDTCLRNLLNFLEAGTRFHICDSTIEVF